jgi:hypothetical protein
MKSDHRFYQEDTCLGLKLPPPIILSSPIDCEPMWQAPFRKSALKKYPS